MTAVLHDPATFRQTLQNARKKGKSVALVPTMGALHEGHLRLVDEAKMHADVVALTIFVNPLQFGPKEDFDRYPRTLDDDVKACASRGVDWVFAPDRAAMYPESFQTSVDVGALTKDLEGAFRPDHFRGVTTVVAKLFGLAGPCAAVFGRKDYQQWRVIDRMARDLDMDVRVIGHPTVREPDGLAMSSRNRYLSAEERERALAIVRGLRAASDAFRRGVREVDALEGCARAEIESAFDRIDYISLRDAEALSPLQGPLQGPAERSAVLLVAAHIGKTRLIDNAVLGEPP